MKILFNQPPMGGLTRTPTNNARQNVSPVTQNSGPDKMTLRFAGIGGVQSADEAARAFVDKHEPVLGKLATQSAQAEWDLLVVGGKENAQKPGEKDAAFQKRLKTMKGVYEKRLNEAKDAELKYTNDPEAFAELDKLRHEPIADPLLKRNIQLLYFRYLPSNLDPKLKAEIDKRETEVNLLFGEFRPEFKGEVLKNDSRVVHLLNTVKDPKELEALWTAKFALGDFVLPKPLHIRVLNALRDSMVGRLVFGKPAVPQESYAQKTVELVRLRNKMAQKGGFKNYYEMGLARDEIDDKQLASLLVKVKAITDAPYQKLREKMDAAALQRYGSNINPRMPWFQGGIDTFGLLDDVLQYSPDKYFQGVNPIPLMKETVKAMGGNIDAMVDASDFFPRDGKNPHWSLHPINPPVDIRSLGNLDPHFMENIAENTSTLKHELIGHGWGYAMLNPDLTRTLRDHSTITTEADAMMMESLQTDEDWLRRIRKLPEAQVREVGEKGKLYSSAALLLDFRAKFLRIVDFERSMYENPEQDLNALWWKKTEEYTGLKKPEGRDKPDWTYKMHMALAPVYYQNYFLGQLMRAQTHEYIDKTYGGLLQPQVADYLKEHRWHGQSKPWSQIVEEMTGRPMDEKALAAEFKPLERL